MTALQRLAAHLGLDPGSVSLEYDNGWRIRGTCVTTGATKVRHLALQWKAAALPSLVLARLILQEANGLREEYNQHQRVAHSARSLPAGHGWGATPEHRAAEVAIREARAAKEDEAALAVLVRLAALLGVDPEEGAPPSTTPTQGPT